MASLSPPHVVIFPFMAQGHTLPLLDLSKALSSHGLKVTIITTPSNAPFIQSKISTNYSSSISLSIIPFPKVQDIPEGCENVANLPSIDLFLPFVTATEYLKQPFEDILKEMSDSNTNPICVISDMFLYWTFDSCCLFDIPRVVFNGMGALPTVIPRSLELHEANTDTIKLQNLSVPFPLSKTDFPDPFWLGDPNHPFLKFCSKFDQADAESWGIILNSFEGLEADYISPIESHFRNRDAKAWLVGPFLLYDQINYQNLRTSSESHINEKQSCPYLKWLDQQMGSGVVIYVSFGTQAHLSDIQMDEIAFGLEMAGQPFIWVTKSSTWVPPFGWEERVKEIGLVARDWVDQRSILAHPGIGGFLSHCGWNSVLEGLSMGVPLLAWPMGAEQPVNAKYVAMGLKAGIIVPQERDGDNKILTVHRDVICDRVKELMRGDEGTKAREKAQELGRMARQAMENGGSSNKKLDQLIESLILKQKQRNTI